MKKKIFYIIFLLLPVFIIFFSLFFFIETGKKETPSFSQEMEAIYTTYSRHLDKQWDGKGWNYSVPSQPYSEADKNSKDNIRLQPTFAMFYRFRHDSEAISKIRAAVTNAFVELPKIQANAIWSAGKKIPTRSFNEVIGMYLALNILEKRPDIFQNGEIAEIIKNIKEMYPWALKADDTENRAFIGAAYGVAVLSHPLMEFSKDEKTQYLEIIQKKMKTGLLSVDKNYLYAEGAEHEYSLHYHLVAASMLYYVGVHASDAKLVEISKKMFETIHKKYALGKFRWDGLGRPRGIGLQTVFLRALGEKILGSPYWKKYWILEKQGLGFIESKNPERLAWYDEAEEVYNDDYSFSNIVELFWEHLD